MSKTKQIGAADEVVVFDGMHHLRRAFEAFCNGYQKNVGYVDAFMVAHNFHKMIVLDIVRRMEEEGCDPDMRKFLLSMAEATWRKAVEAEMTKLHKETDS